MNSFSAARTETASTFARAVWAFDRIRLVWILGHNGANGLSATALFARAFIRASLRLMQRNEPVGTSSPLLHEAGITADARMRRSNRQAS
jgi:single-stranded DNA-specific DHH superfamily exonuclease